MRALVTSLFVCCIATLAGGAQPSPVASVSGGQIRGAALAAGGAVFKGIPFAAPPTGDRRWREPMPVAPWPGIRDATAFGAICPQLPNPIAGEAVKTASEDCLFLNVWTPEWPVTASRPVMVWLAGGGNVVGGSTGRVFDGEPLAARGVVVVTVNYRLGAFGFFSHPALTRESPRRASGNQGLLDQIAALRWVKENIARLGGDPANVTLFGESAGSLDASVLMTSPLTKGLFHRVIAQSGAIVLQGDPAALAAAESRGKTKAATWAAADAPLEVLRKISTADILAGEGAAPPSAESFPNLGVTIDGYVIPRMPAQVFAARGQHPVPLLLGSNAREQVPGVPVPKDLPGAINRLYGPLASRALELYAGERDPSYGTPEEQWGTDTGFRCPTVMQAIWHVAAGQPTFQYEFTHVPPERVALGATHASELSHVFGTFKSGLAGIGPPARATEADALVSDLMQRYWTNFAKTGDPNGPGLPTWPKFDSELRTYVEIATTGVTPKNGLRRGPCEVFAEHIARTSAR